jgi:hypothetical protein
MAKKVQRTIVIKVDQRGAVRAIRDLQRTNARAFGQIKRAIQQTNPASERFKRSLTAISTSFLAVKSAAQTFSRAMRGVAGLMRDAAAQESGIRRMLSAFRDTGLEVAAASEELERFATQMQMTTTFGDDQTRKIATDFATMTRGLVSNVDQVVAATALIEDIATRTGKSADRVTRQLAAVYGGNLEGIKSLLPGQDALVDELIAMEDQGEATSRAIEELNATFRGSAFELSEAEQAYANARNSMGDFREALGDLGNAALVDSGIIPSMTQSFDDLAEAIRGSRDAQTEWSLAFQDVSSYSQVEQVLRDRFEGRVGAFDPTASGVLAPDIPELTVDEELIRRRAEAEARRRAQQASSQRESDERAQQALMQAQAEELAITAAGWFARLDQEHQFAQTKLELRKEGLREVLAAEQEAQAAQLQMLKETERAKVEVLQAAEEARRQEKTAGVQGALAVASATTGLLSVWKGAKRLEFAISAAGEVAKGFATAPIAPWESALHFIAATKFGIAAAMAGGGGGGGGGGARSGGATSQSSTSDTVQALRPEASRSGRTVVVNQNLGLVLNNDESRRQVNRWRDDGIELGESRYR